jgi:hypothetical protein
MTCAVRTSLPDLRAGISKIVLASVLIIASLSLLRAPAVKLSQGSRIATSTTAAAPEWIATLKSSLLRERLIPTLRYQKWQLINPNNNFRSFVSARGWEVQPLKAMNVGGASWSWSYRFIGLNASGDELPSKCLGEATVSRGTVGDVVLRHSSGVEEWYRNNEEGIEQGFLIPKRPTANNGKGITLVGAVVTSLSVASADAEHVSFTDGQAEVFRYSGLKVVDATGRLLPSRLSFIGNEKVSSLHIHINDADAVYPLLVDPLATSPSWAEESNVASGFLGYTVASAGDVNGDGFSDVMVSSTKYDQEYDEGKVSVFYGAATGLPATPSWTAESNQANSDYGLSVGRSIASAGDVNGDGYSDIIIGAYSFDNGQTDEGKVFVYLGSATGLAATAAWSAEGGQDSAYFGFSVAGAGDVNNDGYDDILVGATGLGKAFLYLGSAAGPSLSPNWNSGTVAGCSQIGFSLASLGDVNNDDFSDIILGSPYCSNGETNEGRALIYYGAAAGPVGSPNWTYESNQASAHFGISVAGAGDVNNDGHDDVIVGASIYDNGQNNEGRAYLFLGGAGGVSGGPAWTAESDQDTPNGEFGALFGESVAGVGDIDGDSFDDVLVGASGYDRSASVKDSGRVYLFNGSAAGLVAAPSRILQPGIVTSDFCGRSVAGAGDVNGDGYADVIFACHAYDNGQLDEGKAFVYNGEAFPTPTPTHTPTPARTPTPTQTPTATSTHTPMPSPTPTKIPASLPAPRVQVTRKVAEASITQVFLANDRISFLLAGPKTQVKDGKKVAKSKNGKATFSAKFMGLPKGSYQVIWELYRDGEEVQRSVPRTFRVK